MADRIEELFFKKFTTAEIEAGTRHDFTTDATTAYVIKDIETNQGSDTFPVTGSVTAGKTTDFSAGRFSKIGQFGSLVDSLSGSAILDASSTLSIRPTAQSINFRDIILQVDNSTTLATNAGPVIDYVLPSVNGVDDTSLKTEASVTASNPGSTRGTYNTHDEFAIIRTNANGIKLYMRFTKGTSSTSTVYIVGADNGTDYVTLDQLNTYNGHVWDGLRYIYWVAGGYIYFYDTDASDLTAAGHSSGYKCHGRMTGPYTNYSASSNDHRTTDYHQSNHDGKKYIYQYYSGNQYGIITQLPDTISDGATCPKTVFTNYGGYVGNGRDVYGNNVGAAWNQYYTRNQSSVNQYMRSRLTTFTDKEGTKMWALFERHNATYIWVYMWPESNMAATGSGSILKSHDNNTNNDGVMMLSDTSAADAAKLNWNSAYYNQSSGNMNFRTDSGYLGSGNSSWQNGSYGGMWFDGLTMYYSNVSSDYNVFKINFEETTFSGLFQDNQYYGSYGAFFMIAAEPDSATIASRDYQSAPSLSVRCTGVKEDRST
tara:strand:+ start:1941 stop:3563 length:1623 start_codon:yes stop_codon:yes gene_type:complete